VCGGGRAKQGKVEQKNVELNKIIGSLANPGPVQPAKISVVVNPVEKSIKCRRRRRQKLSDYACHPISDGTWELDLVSPN
jgi:hypothetical protein